MCSMGVHLAIVLVQPLMEAGLDSIGLVELRNIVSTKFGVELPATVAFDYPSVDALARFVVQQTPGDQGASAPQPAARHAARQSIVQHLTATINELLGFEVAADQVRNPTVTSKPVGRVCAIMSDCKKLRVERAYL
jgi:hypothetical protein